MPEDIERIEERLRSEMYTALVELSLADKQDKLQVVNRLSVAGDKLRDLIVHGKTPEV